MNEELRKNLEGDVPLNEIIEKSIPLSNQIVFYRMIEDDTFLHGKKYMILNSYVSTTFMAEIAISWVLSGIISYNDIEDLPNLSVLKITVPKGSKCIFNPSAEYELIFPHRSRIHIRSKKKKFFIGEISFLVLHLMI